MAQREPFYVMMVDYAFYPASLGGFFKVHKGDWIIFENWGKNVHKVVGYAESPDLLPGEMFQVTLNESGTLQFGCGHHENMEFEVIVQEGEREE